MSDIATEEQDFTVTESAAARIAALIEREGDPALKFRVAVLGGGCSGFQYEFKLDKPDADDLVVTHHGVDVLVDEVSMDLLRGSVFDYVEEMIGASFKMRNPNASATCGCGSSFSA